MGGKSTSTNNSRLTNNLRLCKLKEDKFLTEKVFERMSENMHYEIFKYMNSKDLLEIRRSKLGGYQLVSNITLRSRIRNYSIYNPDMLFNELLTVKDYPQKVGFIYEQTGEEELHLENIYSNSNSEQVEWGKLYKILKYIPQLKGIYLGKKNFTFISIIYIYTYSKMIE